MLIKGLSPNLNIHTYILAHSPLGGFQWPITSSTLTIYVDELKAYQGRYRLPSFDTYLTYL